VATRDEAERAIARSPLDAAPYFALALLELELDEHDAAEAALKKVLYLAPNLAEAHYRLGLLRLRRGDVEGARRSLWNALDLLRRGDEGTPSWAASLGLSLAALEERR
jgi:tetratricopeptide (TPR) repeat protein